MGDTLLQLGILILPVLLLAAGMHFVSMGVQKQSVFVLGRTMWLALFKTIGTPIHELGHALFCLIFGHRITRLQLFRPAPDGTLGVVEHRYDPNNIYHQIGNFFIGMGPILLGLGMILLMALLLIGPAMFQFAPAQNGLAEAPWAWVREALTHMVRALGVLFSAETLKRWQFYVFLYLALVISNSITLSPSDIEGSARGFGWFVLFLAALNVALNWAGDVLNLGAQLLSRVTLFIIVVMLVGLALNFGALILFGMLACIKRLLTRRKAGV